MVSGGGDERLYRYDARPFVAFGRDEIMFAGELSAEWQALGRQLASPEYREALGRLIGLDLSDALFEASLFHYGPRSLLEPHCDLADKIVTHVLYFNDSWDPANGGCLRILRSSNQGLRVRVPPVVGSSAVVSPRSKRGVAQSRRTLTATFYRPGSTSTLCAGKRRLSARDRRSEWIGGPGPDRGNVHSPYSSRIRSSRATLRCTAMIHAPIANADVARRTAAIVVKRSNHISCTTTAISSARKRPQAEGVENAEAWQILKTPGCDIAQGYFVSPPLPSSEFQL